MTFFYIFLVLWLAYWSAESGASLPWSAKWQNKKDWYSQIPEGICALTIGTVGVYGWHHIFGFNALWVIGGWIAFILIAYAGVQSATWAYLTWTSHTPRNPDRGATLRPLNDFIASLFGWRLGNEGYSWVWAATKGFITTIPVGGVTGMVFFPLGHEVGSHAKGRLPGDPNMWKELTSGAGLGVACVVFLLTVKSFFGS